MLLTGLLPRSPFASSSADPHRGLWSVDLVSEIVIVVDSVSCWQLMMVVDHDRGGSWWWWWTTIEVAADDGGGPRSRWQLMMVVDHNRGGSWWWWWTTIEVAADDGGGPRSRWQLMVDPATVDNDCGRWWILIVDYDHIRTAWYIIFLLRSSSITDINPSVLWPSVILQSVYSIKAVNTLISLMSSVTRDIYSLVSVLGDGSSHVSLRFLPSSPVQGFSSLTLVEGSGQRTSHLVKDSETNWDLWIWALLIRFDWLIDLLQRVNLTWSHRFSFTVVMETRT